MPIFNNILAGASGQATGYDIDQSLRFDDGDSAYFSRTAGTATSNDIGTLSFWTKRGNLGGGNSFFSNHSDANNRTYVGFDADTIQMYGKISGSTNVELITTPVFRDPSAWYHIVIAVDVTQSTEANRVKIYVNGSQITDFSTATYPAQNTDLPLFSKTNHQVGAFFSSSVGDYYDGYFAEYYYIDGTALTPASFGETNSDTNQWVPIDAKNDLTYGANGFYLPFSATELANSFTDSSRTFIPTENITADFLVIGGGGGGGNSDRSGGGGAGGYRTSAGTSGGGASAESSLSLTSGSSYAVTVGSGGAADNSGSDSSIIGPSIDVTSLGGGAGAQSGGSAPSSGGSGGGGGAGSTGSGSGASGTSGQGYAGGDGASSSGGNNVSGGGGGGAGAVGVDTASGDADGGAGGAGVSSSITGSAVTRAGGGGGGAWTNNGGAGGSGGGGAGGKSGVAGTSGTANTGGGGGGGGTAPGAGGSGIVIIRYAGSSPKASGGTITSYTDGGTTYQVHTFTSSAHTITANGDVANSRAQKKIGSSSIKFDGNGDYLEMPDSSDWDFGSGSWTVEGWFNVSSWTDSSFIWNHWQDDNNFVGIRILSGGDLNILSKSSGSVVHNIDFTSVDLPTDTWVHLAVVRNTSAGNFVIYKDGTSVGSSSNSTAMPNVTGTARINGGRVYGNYWTGYLDEFRVSDTARYTGTFTPSTTAFTADSNTLLLIHSDFNGGLGADNSGNTNDFSPVNLVATDVMTGESPTNNFATLNPLTKTTTDPTMSEGNLKVVTASSGGCARLGTIVPSSGKWYAEFLVNSGSNCTFGVQDPDANIQDSSSQLPIGSGSYSYYQGNGYLYTNGTTQAQTGGATYTTGDIIGIALNLDGNEAKWYKNNTLVYTQALTSGQDLTFAGSDFSNSTSSTFSANFGADSSFAGSHSPSTTYTDANGNGSFVYDPGSYLALCADNLPDVSIKPEEHFNTNLWTGNGSTGQSINVGFEPGLLWTKERAEATHHGLRNSVTGVTKSMSSSMTLAEQTETDGVTAFTSTGFNLSGDGYFYVNRTGKTMVGWSWKAGGTAVSNTDGSITSSVSANTTAGFSIVSYTGQSAAGTVGHGLSQALEMIILKNRDQGVFWAGYVEVIGNTKSISINDSGAAYTEKTWNDTSPTASVFSIGAQSETSSGRFNVAGEDFIAYCFHSVDGYSKVGSYTGNNNADGTFVYTGFRPAWVMVKSYSTGGTHYDWPIYDSARSTYNAVGHVLEANQNQAEITGTGRGLPIDFLSNGFKHRSSYAENNSTPSYIYLAFAESPFKYSNAR